MVLGFIVLGGYLFDSVSEAPKKVKEIYADVMGWVFIVFIVGGLVVGIVWRIFA